MSEEPQNDNDQLQMQAVETDANYEERVQKIKFNDVIDAKYGYERYTGTTERDAWLINFQPSELVDEQSKTINSAVDFYFIEESGEKFKVAFFK
ncbi:hypothetical protein COOONC_13864 [Cooperia oncophora]